MHHLCPDDIVSLLEERRQEGTVADGQEVSELGHKVRGLVSKEEDPSAVCHGCGGTQPMSTTKLWKGNVVPQAVDWTLDSGTIERRSYV